jgi:hypothetical protein
MTHIYELLLNAYCAATQAARERQGVDSALEYLIGEKLIGIAGMESVDVEWERVLPEFAKRIHQLFTASELECYFQRVEQEEPIENDTEQGVRARRSWVRDTLLQCAPGAAAAT